MKIQVMIYLKEGRVRLCALRFPIAIGIAFKFEANLINADAKAAKVSLRYQRAIKNHQYCHNTKRAS